MATGQEINGLVEATNNLLAEVAGQKTRLTTAADNAAASELASEQNKNITVAKAGEASTSAKTATTKAAEASSSADTTTQNLAASNTAKNQAETAATTATTKAGEASTSAATAKTEADRSKTEADKAAGAASAAIKDSYRHAIESATNNTQTVIYDGAGNPNVMFVFPRMRYEDLGLASADFGTGDLSCFDVGIGSAKSEVFIAVHLASGNGYVSQSGADPRNTIDFDTAKAAIAGKGAGWHLMTAHEWSAIALWCMSNGYQPLGNTYYGQSHAKKFINGQRQDKGLAGDASGSARTLTGTVGAESSHNKTLAGIFDLVGNVWEWNDGFKLVNGQLVVSTFNTQAEADWVAQAAFLDSVGGITLSDSVTVTGTPSHTWSAIAKSANYQQNLLLRKLLIEPSTALPEGRLYMNNADERFPLRGGHWSYGSNAGLAALHLLNARSDRYYSIGFRSAFFA